MTFRLEIPDKKLSEAVTLLAEKLDPRAIILFGSRARGTNRPDSDYDLLVIVPDEASSVRQDSDLAYRALRGTGIAADVLVWPRTRFEDRKHVVASLPATVVREGRLLHAA